MSIQQFATAPGLPLTLTNPLTATTGAAFATTLVMPDPTAPSYGEPAPWQTLQTKAWQIRAGGQFTCANGTTPNLTCQVYIGGIAGTQIMTTGAVAVGGTQPSSGSWYLEGQFTWDSISGLNGTYMGYMCGQNAISTQKAQTAIANVTAATYPSSLTFTATGLFSATGSLNTVSLTTFMLEYI